MQANLNSKTFYLVTQLNCLVSFSPAVQLYLVTGDNQHNKTHLRKAPSVTLYLDCLSQLQALSS